MIIVAQDLALLKSLNRSKAILKECLKNQSKGISWMILVHPATTCHQSKIKNSHLRANLLALIPFLAVLSLKTLKEIMTIEKLKKKDD